MWQLNSTISYENKLYALETVCWPFTAARQAAWFMPEYQHRNRNRLMMKSWVWDRLAFTALIASRRLAVSQTATVWLA